MLSPLLIDAHAHLHVKEFDKDRENVIKRAQAAGVSKIINVGFDIEGNFQALALAKKYNFIFAAMGIHPHLASEYSDEVAAKILQTVKREEKIVAIGETGLDYFKNFQPADLQQKVFREQLRLAQKLDLPVIIHCRNAYKDLFKILEEEKITRAVMHCFTGTSVEAQEALGRGYYIGFTAIITYPKAQALQEVVKICPIDRILIETDCPFLAPQDERGKRNEPALLPTTYKKIVQLKSKVYTLEKSSGEASGLHQILYENTKLFFRIP